MNKNVFKQFANFLVNNHKVIAPQFDLEGVLHLANLENSEKLYLGTELPLDSWKFYLLPPEQQMFSYQKGNLKETLPQVEKQIFLGVSVLDLQALTLLNQVYSKDAYYQKIKNNTIVIGTSLMPQEATNHYWDNFEENKLEHINFDIFLFAGKSSYKVYTGSEDGQRFLDQFGYKNYQHIEFAGPIREEGADQRMLEIKEAMQNKHRNKIWNDLGKRCIECGKCTIACPVCFCFRMSDQAGLEQGTGKRSRCWDSCFYNEFTQVAGITPEAPKHRFMSKTAEKIYFWYEHHFVRTPDNFSIPGCVGCGRCTKTCPANIDIKETIQSILK